MAARFCLCVCTCKATASKFPLNAALYLWKRQQATISTQVFSLDGHLVLKTFSPSISSEPVMRECVDWIKCVKKYFRARLDRSFVLRIKPLPQRCRIYTYTNNSIFIIFFFANFTLELYFEWVCVCVDLEFFKNGAVFRVRFIFNYSDCVVQWTRKWIHP